MLPKKAFHYEEGQFICHVYAKIQSEEQEQVLKDVIQAIQREQNKSKGSKDWIPVDKDSNEDDRDTKLHITLIRGHRAVYYHQIKPLIEELRNVCESLEPIYLCLDQLQVLENFERTKQFLCLVSCRNELSRGQNSFNQLKQKLQEIVDRFAIKLTSEDETEDTLAHISLMSRDSPRDSEQRDMKLIIEELDKLLYENLGERPICLLRLDAILIKIGKSEYELKFKT